MIRNALDLAVEVDHANISGILDSLGELKLLSGDLDESERYLEEAVSVAERRNNKWYVIQALRTLARCYLAKNKLTDAHQTSLNCLAMCDELGDKHFSDVTRLVLAETLMQEGKYELCEKELKLIEENENSKEDFFVLGNIQRIRGLLALENKDNKVSAHHFMRSLTIFQTAEDIYHIALSNSLIGEALSDSQPKKATKHFIAASEVFRKLGVNALYESTEEKIDNLSRKKTTKEETSISSHLLMQRLAEATASRELLFRELTSILQQESKARRIIISELNDQNRFYPFITHGYTPNESADIVDKLNASNGKNDLESFARPKMLVFFN